MRMIPADRLHTGKAAIGLGRGQQLPKRAPVVLPERERRTKRIFASERSVRQDLHRIGIADAKQNAANLNAPMRQSIEAIGGGKAKLLHDCPRVVDAESAAGGL